jgi:hypothetical protein
MPGRWVDRQTALSQLISPAKRLPFWLLVLLSLGGYVFIRLWFPLVPYFNDAPPLDIRRLAPSVGAGLGYAALLCALFGLYWLAYRRARYRDTPLSLASILLIAALFSAPLLFTFPFNSTDVYRYFIHGRISVVYRQSSLSTPPDAFPADPYLPLTGEWAGKTSPYGPAWELAAAAVTLFSREDLLCGLLLFKGLAALSHLAIGGLMWLMLRGADPAERAGRVLLWAWNPALLLTFVVNGHNDGWMLLWLLLGSWLMRRGWLEVGQILMVLAPLTKLVGLLPLPFFFLSAWRQLPNDRTRIRFLLASATGSLAMAWLAFLPFGSPLGLAQRLLSEASAGGGFSPVALFILVARRCGLDLSIDPIVQVTSALFVLLALWLLWRTWHGRSPVRAAADVFAAYVVQAFKVRIWYTTWPFPWLLLDLEDSSRRLMAGWWLLLTSQLSVVIYGHFWVHLLNWDHLFAHLIGVPFVFAVPVVMACWRPKDG